MTHWDLDYHVIDMHTHMGSEYCLYYPCHDAASMVKCMDEANIDFIISAPCEDLFDGDSRREQITYAMRKYPKRIRGYYSINPLLGINLDDLDQSFRDNPGYAGLKLLPDYHRTPLTSGAYKPVLEYADDHHMLILSHTWGVSMNGESCNSADEVIGVLEKYHNITFLMGHSIQGQVDDAINIAIRYPNAYLDLCDTCRLNGVLEKMVQRAGAEKIIFGTDAPMQSFNFQLGAVLGARITPNERRMILRDNALRILDSAGTLHRKYYNLEDLTNV